MRLLLAIALTLVVTVPAVAETVYRGEQTLWQDTVWDGEVLIDGILTVAPEVTLEVRPGSVVRFTRNDSNGDEIGEHELFIQGVFLALGTAEKPILFTSAEDNPKQADWGAINMMASTSENALEHCLVEYAYRGFHAHFADARLKHSAFQYNRRGAQFQESTVSIENCRFIDNFNGVQFRNSTVLLRNSHISGSYWGLRGVYTVLEMSGCLVENNLVNGVNLRDSEVVFKDNQVRNNRRGLYLQRSQGDVTANSITDNREHGIFLEESNGDIKRNLISGNGRSGFRVIDSEVKIADNNIVGNDEYGLINDGTQDIRLAGNWWGTADATALAMLIRDGKDRPGFGLVHLKKPLNKPVIP
jgi:parallel beta-helix repeat protein